MGLTASVRGLLIGVLAAPRILVSAAGWETYGPSYPFVSDIAVSSQDELLVYAGAMDAFRDSSGNWQYPSAVFRSLDGGLTWSALANAPAGELVREVAIDPLDPSLLLAVADDSSGSKVYRTQDSGVTWILAVDLTPCLGAAIVFDSTMPGRAYAACGTLFRSEDGVTWTNLGVPVPGYSALRTGADGNVYAVASAQILRSRDHGDTWTQIVRAPSECSSITAFAVDPSDSRTIYVGTGRATPQGRFDCGGLYKSLDGGMSLTRTALPDQYVTDIVVDATDASIVYTCSVNIGFFSPPGRVSRSLDAGQSWEDFSPGSGPIDRLTLSSSGRILYGSVDQAWGSVFRRRLFKTRVVLTRGEP